MIDSILGYLTTTAMPSIFATGGIVGAAGLLILPLPWRLKLPIAAVWLGAGLLTSWATDRCNEAWVARLETQREAQMARLADLAKQVRTSRDAAARLSQRLSETRSEVANALVSDSCIVDGVLPAELVERWTRP